MPPALEIVPLDHPGHFQLRGELDISTEESLRQLLQGLDPNPAVLDLSELVFMDSSGLRVLLQAAQKANGVPRVIVERPSRAVRRLLEVALPTGVPGLEIRE